MGLRAHAADGPVLPRDLVLQPLHPGGQFVPLSRQRGEVVLQVGLGPREKRVLPHEGVPESGQFPGSVVQVPDGRRPLIELRGQVVDGPERAVPFGRQSGHSPPVPLYRCALFCNGVVKLPLDPGQRRRQFADPLPGVREFPVPSFEHSPGLGYVLRKLIDLALERRDLPAALLQVLGQSGVVRVHLLLCTVQLLVFVDGDARGQQHGQPGRKAQGFQIIVHHRFHPLWSGIPAHSRGCARAPLYKRVRLPIRLGR